MGRNKQSTDALIAKGNKVHMSKKELAERKDSEVTFSSDSIIAPGYLNDKMKTQFYSIVNELKIHGLVSNLDAEGIAIYVMAVFNYQAVTEAMGKLKIIKKNKVNEEYTKLSTLQDKYFKQIRQSSSDLGLTVTSRLKLVKPTNEKPKNKFET